MSGPHGAADFLTEWLSLTGVCAVNELRAQHVITVVAAFALAFVAPKVSESVLCALVNFLSKPAIEPALLKPVDGSYVLILEVEADFVRSCPLPFGVDGFRQGKNIANTRQDTGGVTPEPLLQTR